MTPVETTAYLAANGFEPELVRELGEAAESVDGPGGRLFVLPGPPKPAAWAANVWFAPHRLKIASIADGAKQLRAIQRNWALCPLNLHRRATLIQDKLPHVSAKPLKFPSPSPTAPLGSWALLAPDEIFASAACSSPFPNGEIAFVEDKTGPPNRAYLKLWEALTVLGRWPGPGDVCLDLGSSPGGWTWALARLGARVISVDKAPLSDAVARMAGVESRRESAFALKPGDIGPVDWLFSDVVCYPERLYRLITAWIESGLARTMVCTVKFQGETDFTAQDRIAAIPGGRLMHLHHNKHELTWLWSRD